MEAGPIVLSGQADKARVKRGSITVLGRITGEVPSSGYRPARPPTAS